MMRSTLLHFGLTHDIAVYRFASGNHMNCCQPLKARNGCVAAVKHAACLSESNHEV